MKEEEKKDMKLGGGCVKGLMGSRGVDIIIFHCILLQPSWRLTELQSGTHRSPV